MKCLWIWIPFQSLISDIAYVLSKALLDIQVISKWRITQYMYVTWQIHYLNIAYRYVLENKCFKNHLALCDSMVEYSLSI